MSILDVLKLKGPNDRAIGDHFKVQRFVSAVVRGRRSLGKPFRTGSYVDIGCGPNAHADWYNIDWLWRPNIDLCWDVTKGLPFADNSVAGYFSEHCFEHIPFDSFCQVARELLRTLRSGGWVRIVVPDAQIYGEKYAEFLQGGTPEMPYQQGDVDTAGNELYSPVFSLNRIMHYPGHHFIYDFATMQKVLSSAGFSKVEKMGYRSTNDPRLSNDTLSREVESLYVEAQK